MVDSIDCCCEACEGGPQVLATSLTLGIVFPSLMFVPYELCLVLFLCAEAYVFDLLLEGF
jgi:hypothetical protein